MRIQRGKYLFNYKDCWSLDNVLSEVIHAGLVKFKEELVKHPFGGYPHDFHNEIDDPEGEQGFQQWLDTLDKMIYAFDINQEPDIMDYDFKFETEWKTLGNGNSELMSIEPTDTDEYNRYKDDLEIWDKKGKEGRGLFAEYFHNLWI